MNLISDSVVALKCLVNGRPSTTNQNLLVFLTILLLYLQLFFFSSGLKSHFLFLIFYVTFLFIFLLFIACVVVVAAAIFVVISKCWFWNVDQIIADWRSNYNYLLYWCASMVDVWAFWVCVWVCVFVLNVWNKVDLFTMFIECHLQVKLRISETDWQLCYIDWSGDWLIGFR